MMIIGCDLAGGPASECFFPFPFRNCGCPVLALFARAGNDAADTMRLSCQPACIERTVRSNCTFTNSCYHRLPFFDAPSARDRFLAILEQTRQKYRFVVVGYVVMPEHIHLLITEPGDRYSIDGHASSQAADGARAFAQA